MISALFMTVMTEDSNIFTSTKSSVPTTGSISNKELEEKAEWISKNGYKGNLEDLYLDKKNKNTNPDKRSRSLYAESVSEIYQRYHK